MRGPRELLADDEWVGQVQWREHGETRQRGPRPDLLATASDGGMLAFEVELTAKSPARLTAILRLYARWLAEGKLSSLGYVVASERERTQLLTIAPRVGLQIGPRFGIRERTAVFRHLRRPAKRRTDGGGAMITEARGLLIVAAAGGVAALAGQGAGLIMHRYTQLSLANLYGPLGVAGLAAAVSLDWGRGRGIRPIARVAAG